ncbi:MAG: NAD-dependent epimerase/dehydratase family protein [Tunicatimonas sp.]
MNHPPTLLITGGLGNLGSWLTDYFCRHTDYRVSVLASRKRPILSDLDFTFISCDIADQQAVTSSLGDHRFDYVVHTASVNDYFKDNFAEDALRVNALGTRNLLDHFKDQELRQFVYFSTFQVYGQRSGMITEATPPEPKNDYGTTHLFAEYYVKQFHANHGLPYTTFRLTNSYGCPKDTDSSKWYLVLNDLARTAVAEQKIVLKSNGKPSRDFIWMGDVCDIVHRTLELPEPPNDTFNISGEQTFTMLEVATFVQQAYQEVYGQQLPIQINENDTNQYASDLQVSSQKLRQRISFTTQTHFVEEAKNIFSLVKNNG